MSLETLEELESFFDTEDFATPAAITNPGFEKTIKVILDLAGEEVGTYADTIVDTVEPSFLAKSIDVADVKKGYTVTFPELAEFEDGHGKTYKIERFQKDGPQTTKVTLKES